MLALLDKPNKDVATDGFTIRSNYLITNYYRWSPVVMRAVMKSKILDNKQQWKHLVIR